VTSFAFATGVRETERALKKTPGVIDAVVNLATAKATVTYDKDNCTPQQLADSIAKTGYTLELEEKSEELVQAEASRVQAVIAPKEGYI
jgi:Cu+-exporting ATPase